LATYAQRAYLEYALSVVKGRALPDVCDGQKPVQRRILVFHVAHGLGLLAGPRHGAKPVKSARVVGDVLGRYHPHGDQRGLRRAGAHGAGFSQRYPLIDGQGNFGSRDGDGAAAMRYTEARLAQHHHACCWMKSTKARWTFSPTTTAPPKSRSQLPARLPFALLNGASGIAVGHGHRNPKPQPARSGRCLRGPDQIAQTAATRNCCA
jgi:topoisomerase-4 subunit A